MKRLREEEPLLVEDFHKMETKFLKDPLNKIIQNSISANSISAVCQDRSYMQSYDRHFTNVITPQLESTDQENSGRCWIFAVLNVIRHKTICEYQLQDDFELSQSYLFFWDKIEKCNFFLNEIIKHRKKKDFINDKYINFLLSCPISDGGYAITCFNLIKKYGLVPKSAFDESYNSSNTEEMNYILEYKLRQYAKELVDIQEDKKCFNKKKNMIQSLYHIMCKLFGSPTLPDEEFEWTYYIDESKDLNAVLERQKKRKKLNKYENLKLKTTQYFTANQFYNNYIPFDCHDMIQLSNDPRNPYYKCYTSEIRDSVYDGDKTIFLNLPIKKLIECTRLSILDNTPVIFMCDVEKHMNLNDSLLDTKCYDYKSVFNTSFEKMSKKNRILYKESQATHAMIIVGVDLNEEDEIVKWEVHNSWGSDGNFIMSNDWFKDYVFDIMIDQKYVSVDLLKIYDAQKNKPTVLSFDDAMI